MGTFIRYISVFIEAVVCLLLIGVILIQRTKSQGLGMALGGQMGEALFGARMGNVLTRTTVILGIIFLVNTTLLAYLGASTRQVSVTDSAVIPVPAAPAEMPMGGAMAPAETPLGSMGTEMDVSAPVEIDNSGAAAAADVAPVAEAEPVAAE